VGFEQVDIKSRRLAKTDVAAKPDMHLQRLSENSAGIDPIAIKSA